MQNRATALRDALTLPELTPQSAYTLASAASDMQSDECRELACLLFWTSARLRHHPQHQAVAAALSVFERLCVLSTDCCEKVRARALVMLGSLPRVSAELVHQALHKRFGMPPVPKVPRGGEPEKLHEQQVEQAAWSKPVGAGRAGGAPSAATTTNDALMREAVAGCLHVALEDEHASVRYAAVDAVAELVWPDGPEHPACMAPGHAVNLIVESCVDAEPSVRERALHRLRGIGFKLRLKTPQVATVCMCLGEPLEEHSAMVDEKFALGVSGVSGTGGGDGGGVVRAALALLSSCRLDDKAALSVARAGLVACHTRHPGLAEQVARVAHSIGARHLPLALGRSKAGLSKLSAQHEASTASHGGVAIGGVPSGEAMIAHEVLTGALDAQAARDANRASAGAVGVDAVEEEEEEVEESSAAEALVDLDEEEEAVEALLEARVEGGAMEEEEEEGGGVSHATKRSREAATERAPVPAAGTSASRAAALLAHMPPAAVAADAAAAGLVAPDESRLDMVTSALADAAASLRASRASDAHRLLTDTLIAIHSASDASARGDAWLALRLQVAVHVCDAVKDMELGLRSASHAAPALLRLSYEMQYGFSEPPHALLLPWFHACRLWAHAALRLASSEQTRGAVTPEAAELRSRIAVVQAAITECSTSTEGLAAAAPAVAAAAIASVGTASAAVAGLLEACDSNIAPAALEGWLRAQAASVVMPERTAQLTVAPFGLVPQAWSAQLEYTMIGPSSKATLVGQQPPSSARRGVTPGGRSGGGQLLRLQGSLEAFDIPWRSCVLAAGVPADAACSTGGSATSTNAASATPIGPPDDSCLEALELPAERMRPVGKHRYLLSRTQMRVGASSNAASTLRFVCVVRHFAPDVPAMDIPWCTQLPSGSGRAARFISLVGCTDGEAVIGLVLESPK